MNTLPLYIFLALVFTLLGALLGAYGTRQRFVPNKNRTRNEAHRYFVQFNPFNSTQCQAFTWREVNHAGLRANKNPEDF